MLVGEALTDNRRKRFHEPLAVRCLAIVEPERLLIEIAEQVERLDADIRALEATL
jgi:hypothetical protein